VCYVSWRDSGNEFRAGRFFFGARHEREYRRPTRRLRRCGGDIAIGRHRSIVGTTLHAIIERFYPGDPDWPDFWCVRGTWEFGKNYELSTKKKVTIAPTGEL
jgi:hypothetical protein